MSLTIKITKKEIKQSHSMTGLLIDELAQSIGSWDSADLEDNNWWYVAESETRTVKEYSDYESDMLDVLNADKSPNGRPALFDALKIDWQGGAGYMQSELQLGAYIALNAPAIFAEALEKYTDKLKDEAPQYYDSEFMELYGKNLRKAVMETRDYIESDMRKEWLFGDRSTQGVVKEISKYYGAEDADYDDKDADTFYFEFEEEAAAETMGLDYGKKPTAAALKRYLIGQIESAIEGQNSTRTKKREADKKERDRLKTYKQEQADRAETERVKKLQAMTKKTK